MKSIDMAGQRFGLLKVIRRDGSRRGFAQWLCQCACGNMKTVAGANLRSGNTKSCGCLRRESIEGIGETHGQTGTPVYAVWKSMRQRCGNPRAQKYEYYGGRGIKVCPRWNDFSNFLRDMGPRPPGASLDRIDNDGDYRKENCRWAAMSEQARNKRSNRMITLAGVSMCLTDWAKKMGIRESTLRTRINSGMPPEEAVSVNVLGSWRHRPPGSIPEGAW